MQNSLSDIDAPEIHPDKLVAVLADLVPVLRKHELNYWEFIQVLDAAPEHVAPLFGTIPNLTISGVARSDLLAWGNRRLRRE